MGNSVPVDVTDALRAQGFLTGEDANPEDRVYELDGFRVKVKTWHEVHPVPAKLPTGLELTSVVDVFRVAGSLVGDDGKAVRLFNDLPAVYGFGRHVTVHHDADVNLVVEIERLRFDCVRDTIRAASRHREGLALTGVAQRNVRGF